MVKTGSIVKLGHARYKVCECAISWEGV